MSDPLSQEEEAGERENPDAIEEAEEMLLLERRQRATIGRDLFEDRRVSANHVAKGRERNDCP